MMTMTAPAYSIREFEKIVGLPRNEAYRMIRKKRVFPFKNEQGLYRISETELARFAREEL